MDTGCYRIEKDLIGEVSVPASAYYGAQTVRAAQNFPITGQRVCPEMIHNLVIIKKAVAIVNSDNGKLGKSIAQAVIAACEEVLHGQWSDQFITDAIQGGAGTSTNMNVNEVLANRAIELLHGQKGDYTIVNPIDHVNCGQSTNDVYPSAGKMTLVQLINSLTETLSKLRDALLERGAALEHVIKIGRTQLQDAVPIRLGQEFYAYAATTKRDIGRLQFSRNNLYALNLGGTAIGTGLNADKNISRMIVRQVAAITHEAYHSAENLIDSTQNLDCYTELSGALKILAVNLSKMCNDLRLMSSGPVGGFNEINLPARQYGSSIMPGKINPVIPEVVNQIAFNVIGNDTAVTMASEAGQLELNAFEPIIFHKLFESLRILERGVYSLTEYCIPGITANENHCTSQVMHSASLVTALAPVIGYTRASALYKESQRTGKSIFKLALKEGLLTEREIQERLNIQAMSEACTLPDADAAGLS